MKNLGTMNGWSTTPDEYEACINACHKTREVKIGNRWYRVFCDECDICWDYDCS